LGPLVLVLVLGVQAIGAGPSTARENAIPEEIDVVVHPSFPGTSIDAARLETIFNTTLRIGPDGKPIIAFNLPPEDGLRAEFDQVVLRMSPAEVNRYWIAERLRNGHRPPRQIADPMLVRRMVGRLPGGIGYLPRRLVDATVRVVARINAGKVTPSE
jgi:hypothetical protein